MKKIIHLVQFSVFAVFIFLGGAQVVSADTMVTCYKDCNPVYASWEGIVTLDLQCNENSPQSYEAQLTVNGVKTPVNTKTCPSVDIAVVNCHISQDESSCVGKVEWEFFDASSPYEVKNIAEGFPANVFGSTQNDSSDVVLHYGQNEIKALSDGLLVGSVTKTTSCKAGLGWSYGKQKCVVPQVDLTLIGCEISLGKSNCTGSVQWDFRAAVSPYLVEHLVSGFPDVTLGTTNNGSDYSVAWQHGTNIIQAKSNNFTPEATTIDILCDSGLTWSTATKKCIDAHIPVVTLTATPSIVRQNQKSTLAWDISDLEENSCVITGPGLSNYIVNSKVGKIDFESISAYSRFIVTCSSVQHLHEDIQASVSIEVVPSITEI